MAGKHVCAYYPKHLFLRTKCFFPWDEVWLTGRVRDN